MNKLSNIEVAYNFVVAHNEPVAFADIWAEVTKVQGLTEEEAADQIGRFYTNLGLDGRFVTLGENTWDLRSRHTFDKVHIDMNDIYAEEDEDEISEDEEANEYIADDFDDSYDDSTGSDADINQYRNQKVTDDDEE